MQTVAPRTHFACRYHHACLYSLHESLVCCMCNGVFPAAGAGGRARPLACTARPHHCLQVISPDLEPPGGLQVWPQINLSGWTCGDSLPLCTCLQGGEMWHYIIYNAQTRLRLAWHGTEGIIIRPVEHVSNQF